MWTWKGSYISILISNTSKNKKLAQTKVDSTLSKSVLRYQQKICLDEKEKIPKSMAIRTKLLIEPSEFGVSIGYMCDAFYQSTLLWHAFKFLTHLNIKTTSQKGGFKGF